MRREFLDQSGPFASVEAAQAAMDEWTASYNHHRPHQAIDMATPAQRFRPNGPAAVALPAPRTAAFEPPENATREDEPLELVEPAPAPPQQAGAIEFEITVPPKGATTLASHGQSLWTGPAWAGRTATVWADQRTIHVTIDGRHIRTVPSRLSEDHLRQLVMRGARPAGPPPAPSALPGRGGRRVVPAGEAVEIQRNIDQNGCVNVGGRKFRVGPEHSGRRATLRLDGHLMHAISQDVLVATWPCPVPRDQLPTLKGAHTPSGPLPPRPLPAGSVRVQRRVGKSGTMMVGNQKMSVGPIHAGKIVTVIVEDTHFRILHGEEELAVHQRKTTGPITQVKVYARHSRPKT